MTFRKLLLLVVLVIGVGIAGAAYATRDLWLAWLGYPIDDGQREATTDAASKPVKVLLTDKTIESLKLKARPVFPQSSWKKLQIPGMIVDKPGFSDRGIVAPTTSVVEEILRLPGDLVKPGDPLFTLRLLGESLSLQKDLSKAMQEAEFLEEKYQRLAKLSEAGSLPRGDVIDLDNQRKRLRTVIQTARQELEARGLSGKQIDNVARGNTETKFDVVVPETSSKEDASQILEVQEVAVERGKQVLAGQTLGTIANHQLLSIEGKAFADETPLLERSVEEGWPIDVDFQEDPAAGWPSLKQSFHISRLSNQIDPASRTFTFQLPLENEHRLVERKRGTQMLWRFRPGQKVLLTVRVAKFDNVFELPAESVARDVTDSYVFTQNVNTFERVPVRVLYQTRQIAVVANDGSIVPGSFVAQGSAALLNRIAMTQSNTAPKGYHIHADGSLHKNEDEAK